MNPLELVEHLIRQKPAEFQHLQETLVYVLFTPHNGLAWNEDGLVSDETGLSYWSMSKDKEAYRALPESIRKIVKDKVQQRALANRNTVNSIPEVLEENISSLEEVYVDVETLAYAMPDNVDNEWLKVFQSLTEDANVIYPE